MTLNALAKYGMVIIWGFPRLFDAVFHTLTLARRLVRKHRRAEPAICERLRDQLDETVVRHVYF